MRTLLLLLWVGLAGPAHAQAPEPAPPTEQATEGTVAPTEGADTDAAPISAEEAQVAALESDVTELLALLKQGRETRKTVDELRGEERRIGNGKLAEEIRQYVDGVTTLAHDYVPLRDAGVVPAELDSEVHRVLAPVPRQALGLIEQVTLTARKEAAKREDVPMSERPAFERNIVVIQRDVDSAYAIANQVMNALELAGFDVAPERAELLELAQARTQESASRVKLYLGERPDLQEIVKKKPDDADMAEALAALDVKLQGAIDSLRAMLEVLNDLGAPTVEYDRILLSATGEITADMLTKEVATSLLSDWMASGRAWFAESAPRLGFKFLLFSLILGAARLIGPAVGSAVDLALRRSTWSVGTLLRTMIVTWSRRLVILLGLLTGLSQLGINLAPLLAGMGVAGFIVGFALQDTLANFAAGAMILIYRPFDTGDSVEVAGVLGTVQAMSLVSTTILTFDNQTLMVPNSMIWGAVIKNITAQRTRRVDLTFGIGYGDDIKKAERVFMELVTAHPKVLEEPKPNVRVHNLGDSSVDFIVRPWVRTVDYWDVYWDLTREVKLRLDAEGISIPFPQRDVHLFREPESMPEPEREQEPEPTPEQ